MRLDNEQESGNIEDRRGMSAGGGMIGGGLGIAALALVGMFFGIDPRVILQLGEQMAPPQHAQSAPSSASGHQAANDEGKRFVAKVLGSTETTWSAIFAHNQRTYVKPTLVLFSNQVQSACGMAGSAVGPFYCGGDQKVYIDLAFYRDLRTRFHAPGEFAQAYVIAHEVGHHVQNLLGVMTKVNNLRQRVSQREANALSVRLELQADCFAGVWAHHANRERQILEPGDVESGLNAASQIGDDRLQMQARGHVAPESFTHGSSEQRVRWFRTGLESGELRQCDTFKHRD
jgi:hypothetical protein